MVASKTDGVAAAAATNTATNNTTIKKKPTTTSASQKLRSTIIQFTCVALVVSGITLIVNHIAHHGIPDIDPQKVHKAIKKSGIFRHRDLHPRVRLGGVVTLTRLSFRHRRGHVLGTLQRVDVSACMGR